MNLIDFHCDTIAKIFTKGKQLNLKENNLQVDLNKLVKADSLAQFFALYIDYKQVNDPLKYSLKMLDRFYQEIKNNKEKIALVLNYKMLEENQKQGKISAFLTIEEGEVLEGELANLRNFYRLGVRLITLTWNYPNSIGYPNSKKEYSNQGLTSFGKKVIKEMNRLGMIVDVSHLSDAGFYDVAQLSSKPFIASHSNARSLKDHPRNLSDKMIKLLAQNGGIIAINFYSSFLGDSKLSKIKDIVRHIKYIRDIGGIDVIALGSDFDGIDCGLEIDNIGEIERLSAALKDDGFNDDELEKIFYKNGQRIIKEVL